jgi:DNA-binding transcriptional ArsR family regulator
MGIQDCEDCVAPAEAFSVIASETRLAILEALWEAEERPVPFSDLRREVGMRDSAQFNYHLDKLRDHFLHKTEDGYDLRHAGKKVVRAVLAGEFNQTPRIEPFEIEGECAECGGPLQAEYADEHISIECAECGSLHGEYDFPPGGLRGRDREELMRAFDQRVRHLHCLAKDGVCPECGGRMTSEIVRDDEVLGLEVRVDHYCVQCAHRLLSSVGIGLLDQSDVVAAHRAHGIDLSSRPYWTLPWCVTDQHTTVVSTDPWRVAVEIPLAEMAETDPDAAPAAIPDGAGQYTPAVCGEGGHPPEILRVVLDGDLSVRSVEVDPGER